MKGVKCFGMSKKLSPKFIGPFPVIKQVGEVAYKLELPESLSGIHNVFHVSMLRKCLQNPTKHIDIQAPQLQEDLTYEEYRVRILDIKERQTRCKTIRFVKVQWSNHNEDEATWENEEDMIKSYPALFERQGTEILRMKFISSGEGCNNLVQK
jgi:hypothetical protein